MEPTITDLNKKVALLSPITVNGVEMSEITLEKMILRPVMKRIVFLTNELGRVIVYDGETDFEAHKNDSEADLTAALLAKVEAEY